MKYCKRKTYNYIGLNLIETSTDYITEDDIIKFHGKDFFAQWKIFVESKNIKKSKFGDDEGYYYYDYKEICFSTQQYLDS